MIYHAAAEDVRGQKLLNLIVLGRGNGLKCPYDEKFPCLHNNNTALMKQISLIDTTLVMTKTFSLNSKCKKKNFLPVSRSKQRHGHIIIKGYFTPTLFFTQKCKKKCQFSQITL